MDRMEKRIARLNRADLQLAAARERLRRLSGLDSSNDGQVVMRLSTNWSLAASIERMEAYRNSLRQNLTEMESGKR